jgi:hypothetical protein
MRLRLEGCGRSSGPAVVTGPRAAGLAMLLALGLASGGCMIADSSTRGPYFSPGGDQSLCLKSSGFGWPVLIGPCGIIGPVTTSSEATGFSASAPDQRRHIAVALSLHYLDVDDYIEYNYVRFSPDGKRAVLCSHKRWSPPLILDLASGKTSPLDINYGGVSRPWDVDPVWLSDTEVVYAVTSYESLVQFQVFRQRAGEPAAQAVRVFADAAKPDVWRPSPNGQWLWMQWKQPQRVAKVLDVRSGNVRAIDLPPYVPASIGGPDRYQLEWRPDGQMIALVVQLVPPKGDPQPTSRPDNRTRIVLVPMGENAGPRVEHILDTPEFAGAGWTADGKFLVIDSGPQFCGLLDPSSGRMTSLAAKLPQRAAYRENGTFTLRPMPVPGWLCAHASTGPELVAIDYAGETVVPIGRLWPEEISPDGRYGVEIDYHSGKITVHPLPLGQGAAKH